MKNRELSQDATIQLAFDEFVAIQGWGQSKDGDGADGILDHGHHYLIPLGTGEPPLGHWYVRNMKTGKVWGPMSEILAIDSRVNASNAEELEVFTPKQFRPIGRSF
jgi:hypothetical protein